ncbi:hypothetical protein J5U23_00429 [Saccharolobus shibatae B12]|uniref:Uncharacterized protein n=1 Tax=Saccharolobus shibatae (strain ATCC 51178 / DSM 5389 / JCM 8931 / NBRC 15437 / B12) TaxID=523848 RepID=A0A8F5BLK3_SACSH|nr:glycoside hydrolase family 88 protein [Saccharolobus shibatae]QXJ27562.1 hypothetical protein J5U23_00429 [Saccharolobus shibatae B12]
MKFRTALEELKSNIVNLAYEYREKNEFPIYTDEKKGSWITSNGQHWMEGFLVGSLWNLYSFFRDEEIKKLALEYNSKLLAIEAPLSHDIGFREYYSAVKSWENTYSNQLKKKIINYADKLVSLFREDLGFIPVGEEFVTYFPGESKEIAKSELIIDTMMASLPFLSWVSANFDINYKNIIIMHAHKTFDLLVRNDGSTYQAAFIDDNLEIFKHTHQGYSNESCWSRGQTWGIYGYTLIYSYLKKEIFLRIARKLASFLVKNIPEDRIMYYDFQDTTEKDSSSNVIGASALINLYRETYEIEYLKNGLELIRAIINNKEYFREGGLKHTRYRKDQGRDSETIFGDYYLSEALINLVKMGVEE